MEKQIVNPDFQLLIKLNRIIYYYVINHKPQMETDEKLARILQFQEYRREVPTPEHRPWLEVMRAHNLDPFGSEMHPEEHTQQDLTRLWLHNSSYLVPSSMLVQGGIITMTNEQGEVMTMTVPGNSLPRTELSTFSPVKITLDKEQYDTMIKDLEFNGKFADSCAICQEDFKNKENLKITPCEHIFHPKCISTWLKKECTRPTCPSCRHDCREKWNNDSKPR